MPFHCAAIRADHGEPEYDTQPVGQVPLVELEHSPASPSRGRAPGQKAAATAAAMKMSCCVVRIGRGIATLRLTGAPARAA